MIRIVSELMIATAISIVIYASSAWAECRVSVDMIWTGTKVPFSGITNKENAFVAYYDKDRRLAVSMIDKSCNIIHKKILPAKFPGWDSHNEIRIALDGNKIIHLAANMHVSPLTYFSSDRPNDIVGLKQRSMTGRNEDRVTYPLFLKLSNGRLVFLYRYGTSGDGKLYANIQEGNQWFSASDQSILSNRSNDGHVNGYVTGFVLSTDGFYYAAIVWRRTSNASSNYRVSCLKTPDFVKWITCSGKNITLPATPETAGTVDDVGENNGLLNNAIISIDQTGAPVIVYTKYGAHGNNGIFFAFMKNGSWNKQILTESAKRTEISGTGSIGAVPRFTGIIFNENSTEIVVKFPGESASKISLTAGTLVPTGSRVHLIQNKESTYDSIGLSNPIVNNTKLSLGEIGSLNAEMSWVTQGVNRDRPRKCTSAEPKACAPPTKPLILTIY